MKTQPTSFRVSKLEEWEVKAAEKLKSLFEDGPKMTQKSFGKEFGIGTAGMVSQYLNAKRPLGLNAAIKFAKGLDVRVADISPTLAAQLPQENQSTPVLAAIKTTQVATNSNTSIEDLMNELAVYLVQMDDIARKDAAYALERLTTSPDQPDRAAALFKAAFQPRKQSAK